MKDLVVGFSRPKTWKIFAWIIMKLLKTPYDHVYLRLYLHSYEREIIYQASGSRVNFMNFNIFENENDIIKEFNITTSEENYIKLLQFCIDNVAKPYSLKEAFGLGLTRIAKFFGLKIENPFKEQNNSYVCSVIASYIIENFTPIDLPENFQDMDPKDLYDFLELVLVKLSTNVSGS